MSVLGVLLAVIGAAAWGRGIVNLPAKSAIEVLGSIPVEDPACIEGLFFYNGALYQSNGWYGESELIKVLPASGGEVKRVGVDDRVFAEGAVVIDDVFYQLTYQQQVAFMYKETNDGFRLIGNHSYASREGWGLATDGKLLIMSDSTAQLVFIDPTTWREVKRVTVHDATGLEVTWINELEWVGGKLLANHFMSQQIFIIDPETGLLEEYFDVSSLNPQRTPQCKCRCGPPTANGIAYDPATDRLWITGKDWPNYYLVRLTLRNGQSIGAGGGSRE